MYFTFQPLLIVAIALLESLNESWQIGFNSLLYLWVHLLLLLTS